MFCRVATIIGQEHAANVELRSHVVVDDDDDDDHHGAEQRWRRDARRARLSPTALDGCLVSVVREGGCRQPQKPPGIKNHFF